MRNKILSESRDYYWFWVKAFSLVSLVGMVLVARIPERPYAAKALQPTMHNYPFEIGAWYARKVIVTKDEILNAAKQFSQTNGWLLP